MKPLQMLLLFACLLAVRPGLAERRQEGDFKVIDEGGKVRRVGAVLDGHSVCVPAEFSRAAGGAGTKPGGELWSEDGGCGERVAAGIVTQVAWRWPRGKRHEPTPDYFIEAWSRQHELGEEGVREVAERWAAEVEKRSDRSEREQALAAFLRGDYKGAVRYASLVEGRGERRPPWSPPREGGRLRDRVVEALLLQGAAYNASGAYEQALRVYARALEQVSRWEEPRVWAAVMHGYGYAHAAQGGEHPDAEAQHLERAISHYRQALEVYEREQELQMWAAVQESLGTALLVQSFHQEEERMLELLEEGKAALQKALEAYPREQVPRLWSSVQSRVGAALRTEGEVLKNARGMMLLQEAVQVLRAAAQVCLSLRAGALDCSNIQMEMARALRIRGSRLEGEEEQKLWEEAVAAYRTAWEMNRREQNPDTLATVQHELGSMLASRGKLLGGREGLELLTQAVAAYQEALAVYEREREPQSRAGVVFDLGIAFQNRGIILGGRKGLKQFGQSVSALEIALSIYNRRKQPQQWAKTKALLGISYLLEAQYLEPLGQLKRLKDAAEALKDASTILCQPDPGAEQCTVILGTMCVGLKTRSMVSHDKRMMEEAARTCSEPSDPHLKTHHLSFTCIKMVLEDKSVEEQIQCWERLEREARAMIQAHSREPEPWAGAQMMLGTSLVMQARWIGLEDSVRYSTEAVGALRQALTVFTARGYPTQWRSVQVFLGLALANKGRFLEGREGERLLEEAVQVLEGILQHSNYEPAPEDRAFEKDTLCYALQHLGERRSGGEGVRLLQRAVKACEEALEVATAEASPQEWRQSKNNLNGAWRKLMRRRKPPPGRVEEEPVSLHLSMVVPGSCPKGGGKLSDSTGGGLFLSGQILLLGTDGRMRAPAEAVEIRLRDSGVAGRSSPGSGCFKLWLSGALRPGDPINLSATLEGYELVSPMGGQTRVPDDLESTTVHVLLRPSGARQSLADGEAARQARWLSEEIKRLIVSTQRMDHEPSQGAQADLHEARRQLAEWLNVGSFQSERLWVNAMDTFEWYHGKERRRILESFGEGQYERAVSLAKKAVELGVQSLRRTESSGRWRESGRRREELMQDLLLLGQAHRFRQEFVESLVAYERALEHAANEGGDAFTWARLHDEAGLAHLQLAMMGAAQAKRHVKRGMRHLELAMEVFTRDSIPESWASARAEYGVGLLMLALMENGDVRWQRLREAEEAQRAALEVFEVEHLRFQEAQTRLFLGMVASLLSYESNGGEGGNHSRESEAQFNEVLSVLTMMRSPTMAASAYYYRARNLLLRALRKGNGERSQWLAEAEAALSQALRLIRREEYPSSWASIQYARGAALVLRALLIEGEAAGALLREAVRTFDEALGAIPYGSQSRAGLQGARGLALIYLAEVSRFENEAEGWRLRQAAKDAFQEARESVSSEDAPMERSLAQYGLCIIQRQEEERQAEPQGVQPLAQALSSCQELLK